MSTPDTNRTTSGWYLWFVATVCAGIGIGLKISIGDGFVTAAAGFAVAATAAMIRDVT